jgi:hypothetical protein
MPKYLIERELPGAGKLTSEQLQAISQKSCEVLKQLGPQIQWLQSYVTDDKISLANHSPTMRDLRSVFSEGNEVRERN